MKWRLVFAITFLLTLSTLFLIASPKTGISTAGSDLGCSNIPSSWTYCNYDKVCKSVTSPPTFALAGPTGCPEGFSEVPWSERDQPAEICAIATAMVLEPNACPTGCDDGGVETGGLNGGGRCCTASKYRVCKDKPAPAPHIAETDSGEH